MSDISRDTTESTDQLSVRCALVESNQILSEEGAESEAIPEGTTEVSSFRYEFFFRFLLISAIC